MAASVGENGLAPTEFQINLPLSSESTEDLAVAVEHCPLCFGRRRPYTCDKCVNSGAFIHSNGITESFSVKRQNLNIRTSECQMLLQRIESFQNLNNVITHLRYKLHQCHEQMKLLQLSVFDEREFLQKEKTRLLSLQEDNCGRSLKSKRYSEKLKKITDTIAHVKLRREAKSKILRDIRDEVAQKRCHHVRRLSAWIFPIHQMSQIQEPESSEVGTVSELKDAMQTEDIKERKVYTELKDAMQTAYIKERWVHTDDSSEIKYRIIESTLPANGDYPFSSHLGLQRPAGQVSATTFQNRQSHEVVSGLGYLAQFVTILSRFLDINLLRHITYREFCGRNLSEESFVRCVHRLNHNIMYLALTQGLPADDINPYQPIHSVLDILNSRGLGREESCDIPQGLFDPLEEEQFESDDEDTCVRVCEEETGIQDWEQVPRELTDVPHEISDPDTNIAGSLITSAASSVMSLWKAATSPFERR